MAAVNQLAPAPLPKIGGKIRSPTPKWEENIAPDINIKIETGNKFFLLIVLLLSFLFFIFLLYTTYILKILLFSEKSLIYFIFVLRLHYSTLHSQYYYQLKSAEQGVLFPAFCRGAERIDRDEGGAGFAPLKNKGRRKKKDGFPLSRE